ncbi:murein biosynthesis integral membrane protein MurJ [Vibrio natriegens]|uniref:murein biosynthesis integral membrane protein MurJ n=1 Tax=Vibrio natriegens TaxID=691 RepID=UPI003F8666D9
MKKAVVLIFIFSLLSKLVGFVRELFVSYFYGVSPVTDAFNVAQSIPGFFLTFFGIAISTTLIPVYNRLKSKRSAENADCFFSTVCVFFCIISLFTSAILIYFSESVVFVFAPGLIGEAKEWAIELTKICCLGILLYSLTFLFNSYLNAKNKFIFTAFTNVPYNLVLLFSVFYAVENGVEYLAVGKIIGSLIQVMMLTLFAIKSGLQFKINIRDNIEEIKNIFRLAIPAVLGSCVEQINRVVDKNIASSLMSGGISIINYSERLILLVEGILISPIILVVFSKASQYFSKEGEKEANDFIKKSIRVVIIISFPLSVFLSTFSHEVVEIVYGRGEFVEHDVIITSSLLSIYSLTIFFNALRQVVSRYFYAIENTKTPMWNAMFGMACNIALNIILSKIFGMKGLALATLISSALICILMFYSYHRKSESLDFKDIFVLLVKVLTISLFCVVLGVQLMPIFVENAGSLIGFFMCSMLLLFSYVLALFIFKIQEIEQIKNKFIKKVFHE